VMIVCLDQCAISGLAKSSAAGPVDELKETLLVACQELKVASPPNWSRNWRIRPKTDSLQP
jgi:hypothetical protein